MADAALPAAPVVVRLGDDRVVVKRGFTEVALGGDAVASEVEEIVGLLGAGHDPEDVLDAVPVAARARAARILRAMRERGMLEDAVAVEAAGLDGRQRVFYRELGRRGAAAIGQLAAATVAIVGENGVTAVAARELLASGVGEVRVVPDDGLDADGPGWPDDPRLRRPGDLARALDGARLLCVASEAGEVDALYDANRVALEAEVPFLPAWIDATVAHVGPLAYPRETACLRCYRLRADANDRDRAASAAVRRHLSASPAARAQLGTLPPMVTAAGALLAMEALKGLAEVAPSDTVGRHVELNLLAFDSRVRRVLKIPRCPDCSDAMRHKPTALLTGPQIPVPAPPHAHRHA
jgi:bacteriocin biosynthesis cyclodehydratase domain-containing protein